MTPLFLFISLTIVFGATDKDVREFLMKTIILLSLVLISAFSYGQEYKEVYSAGISMFIPEIASTSKEGNSYKVETQCTAYCSSDENADHKIVKEAISYGPTEAKAEENAKNKCHDEIVKECAKKDGTYKKVEIKAPKFSCDWLDGKKLLGTATHNAVSCKSKVCSGEVICSGGSLKSPISKFVICEAVDNKCPSAIECTKGDKVEELQQGNFDVKYGDTVKSGAMSE